MEYSSCTNCGCTIKLCICQRIDPLDSETDSELCILRIITAFIHYKSINYEGNQWYKGFILYFGIPQTSSCIVE